MKLFWPDGEKGQYAFHLVFKTQHGEGNAHWAATLKQISEIPALVAKDTILPLHCDEEDTCVILAATTLMAFFVAIGQSTPTFYLSRMLTMGYVQLVIFKDMGGDMDAHVIVADGNTQICFYHKTTGMQYAMKLSKGDIP